MSTNQSQPLPTTGRLLKATALALIVAAILLVTTVLPAEYGIDPTGIGTRLGLGALSTAEAAEPEEPVLAPAPGNESGGARANAALSAKAVAVFGKAEGQSLDAGAVSLVAGTLRRDTFSVTLAPGKGAEVKAHLKAGAGIVFNWKASADVAVDMHGERPDAKKTWTSYAVESAQRQASGTFIAPFDGSHGWYWQNRGDRPVTVDIEVAGFQQDLYRP
jgi:hypothetical protein